MSEDEKNTPEADENAKQTIYFELAIEAWCNQFKPADDPDQAEKISMYEILEALDSYFGTKNGFSGTSVFMSLKERGYMTAYDGVENQFKILVSQ